MENKSLLIGMFVSMAAFSVKAGIGWAYLVSRPMGFRRRTLASCGVAASYAALFAAVYAAVSRINVMELYQNMAPLISGGVTLHWASALLIFVWGLFLLGRFRGGTKTADCCDESEGNSKAWLALVIPCPVCMCAVFISAACLALYFPDDAARGVLILYAAFILLAGAGGALSIAVRNPKSAPEESLGLAMMLIAAYFIVSALVTPQFADVSRVYRLALYSGETKGLDPAAKRAAAVSILALFGTGFFSARFGRSKRWSKMFPSKISGGKPEGDTQ